MKKRFIFALILLALLLGATEFLCHLLLPTYYPESVVPQHLGRFDPQFGWSLKPNPQGTSSRTGREVHYQINSLGIRGPETQHQKPDGVFRILLLGDSRTFGYGVPIERYFGTLLEGYFQDVEVINLGISGFGIDQELLFYQERGRPFNPDVVISYVAHYKAHRHMHGQRWEKDKPFFELENGQLVLKNSPTPSQTAESQSNPILQLNRWLQRNSRAYGTVSFALHVFTTGSKMRPDDEQQVNDKRDAEDPEFVAAMNELGFAIIQETQKQVTADGSVYIVATPMPELLEPCQANGIPTLDLRKSMGNERFQLPNRLSHINDSGNGVLAWEIARYLEENDLIPPKHRLPLGSVSQ